MSGDLPMATGPEPIIDPELSPEDAEQGRKFARDYKISPERITEQLNSLDHVTLNVAVTGSSGSGKSTFVNAIRGLANDDEGAAKAGVTETTRKPCEYQHPTMPNVSIWDLPGIGTARFRAKNYLSDVKFERYDFFIIINSERFRENDILLAKEISKQRKLFFFIRSKVDNDVNAESRKQNFNEERLLSDLRNDCQQNLKCFGNPKVFLISSFELDKFDFQLFINTLERELPDKKKHALIQSLPVYSIEALEKKEKYYKKMVWLSAFGSGVLAVVPVPGMTIACDYGIIMSFFQSIFSSFGLQDKSLQALGKRVKMNWEDLKGEMISRFKDGVNPDSVASLLKTPAMASIMTLKALMSGAIPFAQLPAGVASLAIMHYLLNQGLKEMGEDARRVLTKARLHQY